MIGTQHSDPIPIETDPASHALARIAAAEIRRQPFPHIIVDGLFPEAFYRGLLAHFPSRERFEKVEYPGTGHSRTAANYHDYGLACRDLTDVPFFRDVHALFKSEAFTGLLLRIFGGRLADGFYPIPPEKHRHFAGGVCDYSSVFDLQIDLPGYAIPPHPDVPSKLVTFQFFLPQDDALAGYGTMLCALKGGAERSRILRSTGSVLTRAARHFHQEQSRPFKWLERTSVGLELGVGDTANWLPWSRAEVVTIAPARPNCFMAFAPNAISYHAVRFDVPATTPQQERPVVRGFIRAGANTDNWMAPKRT